MLVKWKFLEVEHATLRPLTLHLRIHRNIHEKVIAGSALFALFELLKELLLSSRCWHKHLLHLFRLKRYLLRDRIEEVVGGLQVDHGWSGRARDLLLNGLRCYLSVLVSTLHYDGYFLRVLWFELTPLFWNSCSCLLLFYLHFLHIYVLGVGLGLGLSLARLSSGGPSNVKQLLRSPLFIAL